ncbi:MAG: HAD family phosphatase [Planctomycetaceae bacterium]|jgi:HAD superfamily hydrolase (TIGR01509 family)|nr:HAD family phosphatase [Planctomycetaceae bacterium]MBT6153923.1 HAD family phosphatase [Planctomycetaceae bacterium]MBT6486606.1 HAD family phosphatase [Planctomycetaceae bacterium]MBT6498179.1 HAD family phosphatase [Planctomycetaceae bacterium]
MSPAKNTQIKAVVFDLDGLMFNTEDVFNLSGRELLRRRGKELTNAVLSRMMGRRAVEAFQVMKDMCELSESIPALRAESQEIFDSYLEIHLAPMPGLFDLLERIESRGLPKGVATSSGRSYLIKMLDRYSLSDRFETLLAADDVTHGKPHPEIYLTAAERIGVDPTEMLVLEDSENGTRAAAAAGAVAVSVPHVHSQSHDFSVATHVVDSLHDPRLFDLLGS